MLESVLVLKMSVVKKKGGFWGELKKNMGTYTFLLRAGKRIHYVHIDHLLYSGVMGADSGLNPVHIGRRRITLSSKFI